MANNYLLLRDNKQSGPYSLADLREFGIKAYDLVWVQGKSAAWRYPSEIEELKDMAPIVEEQPFDRFYKKSTEEKKEVDVIIQQHEEYVPKKSVFVTLPGQKKVFVNAEVKNSADDSRTIIVKENPAAAQVKFLEPVDEIKEMYAKSFQQRKQKIARKNSLVKNIKKASVFLYMIALGIMIGLTFKISTSKKSIAASQPATVSQQVAQVPMEEPLITKEQSNNTIDLQQTDQTTNVSSQPEKPVIQKQELEKRNTVLPKKENTQVTKPEIDPNQISPGVDINSSTGERNKKSRTNDNPVVDNQTTGNKMDISKYVSLKGSDYKRGAFGGIRDLQLTVTNNSKYVLDNVVVELQYLKPSEQPLKSQNIEFKSIAPNGSLTILIPPSNRGISVAYKIIKIESKEVDNSTAGL